LSVRWYRIFSVVDLGKKWIGSLHIFHGTQSNLKAVMELPRILAATDLFSFAADIGHN
jgi:hypothetical protein